MEIAVILLSMYFIPSIVALTRGHTQVGPIFVVNLFLGWTFVGWVGCLAWCVSGQVEKANSWRKLEWK